MPAKITIMKITYNFFIFITLLLSFLMIGCEQKAEFANALPQYEHAITNRYVDECGDCPNMDDCCGRILFASGIAISFETCGTTDGDAAACSDNLGTCLTIDGLKNSSTTMDDVDEYRLICMEEDHGFFIKVTSVTGTVVLNITLQHGQLSPQSINVTITSTGTYGFSVNDDCEVSQCYP